MVVGVHSRAVIIVVTFNSEKYIRKCLDSLIEWSAKSQIIVVDNNSRDRTVSIISEFNEKHNCVICIELNENIGFGPAHNVVFSLFPSHRYILINQDAWLIGDTLDFIDRAMDNDDRVGVCGIPLVYPDGKPQSFSYPFSSWQKWFLQILRVQAIASIIIKIPILYKLLSKKPLFNEYLRRRLTASVIDTGFSGQTRDVDWVCGAAMVLNGDFVKQCGGFDNNIFLYGEDEDICLMAHKLGFKVVAVDAPPVVHVFGWGVNKVNHFVADLKYTSLKYFIQKNMRRPVDRFLMRAILPLHVYGFKGFFRAFVKRN